MSESATQLYAKLVKLRNNAGEHAYLRIATAAKLLEDRGWVESAEGGGGDADKALTRLEENVFADLCGGISLVNLLEIYYHVPDVSKWEKHKYNLRKIWAEWHAKQSGNKKKARGSGEQRLVSREYVAPNKLEDLTPSETRREYGRVYNRVETLAEKCGRLEEENAALKEENGQLKETLRRLKGNAIELFKVG